MLASCTCFSSPTPRVCRCHCCVLQLESKIILLEHPHLGRDGFRPRNSQAQPSLQIRSSASSSPCSLRHIFMQWGRCHHDRDQEICTPDGQNVHCGLISLKAEDNWRCRENRVVCKVEGQLGRRKPLTLERLSPTEMWAGRMEWGIPCCNIFG